MTPGHGTGSTRRIPLRPVGDPLHDVWADVCPLVISAGCGAIEHPCLSVDEIATIQQERAAALARKRPVGFGAVWPDDEQPGLRRVA